MSKIKHGMKMEKGFVLKIMSHPESFDRRDLKKIGGFGTEEIFAYIFDTTVMLTLETDQGVLKNWSTITHDQYDELRYKDSDQSRFEICRSILTGSWAELDEEDQYRVLCGHKVTKTFPLSGHGGARPGAGRKPVPEQLKKRQIGVQLPEWMITKLDKLAGKRQALIEQALLDKYGWEPPNID